MADDASASVEVEIVHKRKETWTVKVDDKFSYEGYVATVLQIVSPTHVRLNFSKEGKTGPQANWPIADMAKQGFRRLQNHDFSDRYCAARGQGDREGEIVRLCGKCGTSEALGPAVTCTPRQWRADLESYLASQMQKKDDAQRVPDRPREQFRQCNPILAGGIFSLRDES